MRTTLAVSLAALLVLASPAVSQDAPAPAAGKHVNKVTDAAKAAFERMDKAAYRPVAAGLKELSGTMVMKMEGGEMGGRPGMGSMPGMDISFSVAFKAPADLKVEPKGDAQGPGRMMAGGMKRGATALLRSALGLHRPADDEEYDADAATEGGKTVLTIVRYANGVETDRSAMTLDDRGLIESMKTTSKARPGASAPPPGMPAGGMRGGRGAPPGGDESSDSKFTWRKEGDRWLLEKMTSTAGQRAMEITPVYMDAGGFRLMSSWKMSGGEGPAGGMSFGFRFTELTVNGKKVDVPAEGGAAGKPGGGEDE